MPFGPPLGVKSVGYLMDRIDTRDAWMHRVDLTRATGRPLVLTADHDGRLVDDVVREWAAAHGRAYRLTLTGPAGGSWSRGAGGASIELDAIELCRVVSGRAPGRDCSPRASPSEASGGHYGGPGPPGRRPAPTAEPRGPTCASEQQPG